MCGDDEDFYPVAGRKDHRLKNTLAPGESLERVVQMFLRVCQPFPDLDRGCFMIDPRQSQFQQMASPLFVMTVVLVRGNDRLMEVNSENGMTASHVKIHRKDRHCKKKEARYRKIGSLLPLKVSSPAQKHKCKIQKPDQKGPGTSLTPRPDSSVCSV